MLPLGGLTPPDPSEKWKTIKAALESEDKTRRLCRIIFVASLPVMIVAFIGLMGLALTSK